MKGKNERKENNISRSKWKETEVDIEMPEPREVEHTFFPSVFLFAPYSWFDLKAPTLASVSVLRSYAKGVLGTKTLTLPTQDNG